MPNYRRYYVSGRPVFVTLVAHERRPWLVSSVEILRDSWTRVKECSSFRHLAHVVMPDHLHWLFEPAKDGNFSAIVGAFKRDVTWRMKEAGTSGPLWQSRFYDHLIRDDTDFARHVDYIHYNPVKHGISTDAGDCPHSSFSSWIKRGMYTPDWGRSTPAEIADWNLE